MRLKIRVSLVRFRLRAQSKRPSLGDEWGSFFLPSDQEVSKDRELGGMGK
jgi:hypothetical protein